MAKSTATIKDYSTSNKTKIARQTSIPKDFHDETGIKHGDSIIWERLTLEKMEELIKSKKLKGLFLVYKEEEKDEI